MKNQAFFAILIAALALATGCGSPAQTTSQPAETGLEGKLIIFHAGSLTVPLEKLTESFQAQHPAVTFETEASGSRSAARKISELGREADVMMSADYTVIDNLLTPNFAAWNVQFARNTMVSIRLIKGYTRERRQIKEFEVLGARYVAGNLKVAVIQGLLFPVSTLVGNAGMLLVLYFGGKLVIANRITLGDFVAFVTYMYMLIWPMMAVGWVTNLAQRGLTSLARIYRLLAAQPLLDNSGQLSDEPRIQSFAFSCRNLHFSYPAGGGPALDRIDLEIGPGILGVAGRTGSGKSTLCRLLTRQYPVAPGRLFFSGHDVNDYAPSTIRSQVSYVSQQPVLFSGSVAENISLAIPEATTEEIKNAARLAGIHDEIMAMQDGYDSTIGERGLRLSGGQKQRIAIARALLADRPILIIDDALSALDVETEQQVFQGIRSRLQGKTVLIVSHRLRLLSGADRVIILDRGRIVDQGSHQLLLARNDFYQTMARKQGRADA
jgi:ATP-binding cassette subfamily B protein